ncbi:hypothetical protein GH733_011657, partial [Mirounga leonina]
MAARRSLGGCTLSTMRRFLRSGHDPARERLKRDLFQFNKTVEHGFPHQPSALGYSLSLRILAIGTRSGAVKLYGAPGVEFMGLHRENNAVVQIHFLPGQCQLVTLLDDNSLHLWSLKVKGSVSELQEDESFTLRGPPGAAPSATQITVVLPHSSGELLYLGTESGNVFVVQLPAFRTLEDQTISSDAVLQRLPEEARHRRVFEMVEALQEHPRDPNQVLIGYSRGLVVVWDLRGRRVLCHFLSSQQLENVCWQRDGHLIVSCHSDGSYGQWPVSSDSQRAEPLRNCVPYGPFPCKAITKIFWLTTRQGLPFTIFQGGMPRASYGDRHCISVVHDGQQTAFDFTSRVIDFTVLTEADPAAAFDDPYALVVLAEEELVVIDLRAAGWPPVQPPYLASLHCSAITCSHHVSNIPLKLWERLVTAGSQQHTHFSTMEWPIDGGTSLAPAPPQRDLLLTGHEDGTVRFWDASGVCLRLLYKLSTVRVFVTDTDPSDNLNAQGEDEWPPLRKVGSFDPYSDDPRLGIQKIFLCKYSGYLAVAGTAGQVLVLELNDEEAEHAVEQVEADLLQDQEGYRWKGHERLCARPGPVHFEPGFQPFVLVQCQPPAVVTSLALHSEWRLVAFGTSHGFGLFDHQQRQQVFVKCTLHPSDQLALEGPLSRVKSLKKSLRQSFRRIRRSRVSSRKRRPAGPPGEVFTLPKVSAKLKLKLTALEGSRVRRVSVAHFSSCRAEDYGEHHLAVLTNLGDVQVVSLPLLKPQVRYSCIRREDVSGIASCVFTKYGQGFYLISPSEFERFSLSTKWLVEPRCLVDSTKSHSRPPNGSGPEKALGQARNSGSQSDGEERSPGPVMEHALLNDERVLKEIQSTLEGDRGSYGNWRPQQMAVGYSLSNGG